MTTSAYIANKLRLGTDGHMRDWAYQAEKKNTPEEVFFGCPTSVDELARAIAREELRRGNTNRDVRIVSLPLDKQYVGTCRGSVTQKVPLTDDEGIDLVLKIDHYMQNPLEAADERPTHDRRSRLQKQLDGLPRGHPRATRRRPDQ